jgi:uncharacterized protein YeeX (DUF496 family)
LTKYEVRGMQQRSIADVLSLMKERYEEEKSAKNKRLVAKLFSQWIDKAYFYGVIKEGSGSIRRLQECNAQKDELQKLVDQLVERNAQLEFENKDLQARLDQADKIKTHSEG